MKAIFVVLFILGAVYAEGPVCTEVGEDDHVVLLPNPEDCSTFYSCVDLTPVLMDCLAGLWFNPTLSVCDWPQNIPEGVCKPPAL